MAQVLILITLAGVTHAFIPVSDSKCDTIQNTSQCSVTLGGSVYVQMMANASGLHLRCKKMLPGGPINVFNVQKEHVMIQDAFRSRTEFFINNGTFKITSVERTDSGQYLVDVFDPNGLFLKNILVKLDVQENIFPILIPVCSALGCLLIVVVISCTCRAVRQHRRHA